MSFVRYFLEKTVENSWLFCQVKKKATRYFQADRKLNEIDD